MVSQRRRRIRKIWVLAFGLTLLFHALTLLGMNVVQPFEANPVEASAPEPIEMVFEPLPPPPPPAESEEPSTFSEMPPDRADEAPEDPDFLSNVSAMARDRDEDGIEGDMPKMTGQGEAPHVRMDPGAPGEPAPDVGEEDASAAEETSELTQNQRAEEEVTEEAQEALALGGELDEEQPENPAEALTSAEAAPKPEEAEPQSPDVFDGERRQSSADPADELIRQQSGTGTPELVQLPSGRHDIYQEEMYNPGGNTAQFGDITLNTVEWAYAPWLQRFVRDFLRNWHAPYAYYLGVIDGWTLVELEIDQDGKLLRLDKVDELGHDSLGQQSVASFRATAPFRPLPANFPEPTLILRIKLIYPPHR